MYYMSLLPATLLAGCSYALHRDIRLAYTQCVPVEASCTNDFRCIQRPESKAQVRREPQNKTRIHILFVGPMDCGTLVHDALLELPDLHISIAADYRELWAISQQELPHLAILNSTLSIFDLDDASRFIRQRWPHAQILVLRTGEGFLDDALYDERIEPDASPNILLAVIEALAEKQRDRGFGNAKR